MEPHTAATVNISSFIRETFTLRQPRDYAAFAHETFSLKLTVTRDISFLFDSASAMPPLDAAARAKPADPATIADVSFLQRTTPRAAYPWIHCPAAC
jgi:hypothetical protein